MKLSMGLSAVLLGSTTLLPAQPVPRVTAGPQFEDLDLTGGSLSVGQFQDGTRAVSATILVGDLEPPMPYVVFAWWSINQADTPKVTIETGCLDLDGDGHVLCGGGGGPLLPGQVCGDCDDGNPRCATDCMDGDADGWCVPNDCNDAVATCNQDCTSDVDADARADCMDACLDPDRDGYGAPGGAGFSCAGFDCLEGNPFCNTICVDDDFDTYCIPADCADDNISRYPGAPEVNDGLDNDCNGLVDEGSDQAGFCDPSVCGGSSGSSDCFCWPAQQGATSYQVARLFAFDEFTGFSAGSCLTTSDTFWSDPQVPSPGEAFFYIYHPLAPFAGSWGESSSGVDRDVICAAHLMGACGTLNVKYQKELYEAKSCDTDTQCSRTRVDGLICPCRTYINNANVAELNTMSRLSNVWLRWFCHTFWVCPAAQCPVLSGSYCGRASGHCVDIF